MLTLPGSVVVTSDAMLAYRSGLERMAQELREVGAAVGTILRSGWMPLGGRPCVPQLQLARQRVAEAESSTAQLAHAMQSARLAWNPALHLGQGGLRSVSLG